MIGVEKTKAGFGTSLSNLQGAGKSGGASFDDVLAQLQAAAGQNAPEASESAKDLRADYQTNLKQLREQLEKLLNSLGIDTTGMPLKLQAGLGGGIVVSGAHPRSEEVQAAINQDPQLAALFNTAAQQGEQIQEAEQTGRNLPGVHQWKPRFSLEIDGITQTPSVE